MHIIIKIEDDPWSEWLKNFVKQWPHYKTVKQWIENPKIDFKDTYYYQWLLDIFVKEGNVWNGILKNEIDILNQCEKFKKMLEVAPNWEIEKDIRVINGINYYFGDITAKIDANGDIDIWDGHHRIAILLALNLPINVTICERCQQWQQFTDEVKNLYSVHLYQPIPHPDFQDWKYCRSKVKESIIHEIVTAGKIRSILDLGSCHGFIPYTLKDLITSCTGVESDPVRFKILKLLFERLSFNAVNDDIFNFLSSDNNEYDCIFALAVFHHFTKYNPIEKFMQMLDLIRKKSNMLIYELPEPNESQYEWLYKNVDLSTMIHSRYQNTTEYHLENRKLYLCMA
jgi:hypothetical protein